MSSFKEGFRGTLDIGKRRREIIPALLRSSLLNEDELHIPLQFRFNENLPLVISFYEYYRFLARLVDTVLRENIAPLVLLRVKMPAVIALPPILLDARVAIFYDLDAESEALSERGVEHLCVDADFKLYAWSAGDNAFSIRWVSPAGRRLGGDALARVRAVVETLPAAFEYFADAGAGAHVHVLEA